VIERRQHSRDCFGPQRRAYASEYAAHEFVVATCNAPRTATVKSDPGKVMEW
jgi:hypothetical protein